MPRTAKPRTAKPKTPEGCKCDPRCWGDQVEPVCSEFKLWEQYSDELERLCERCEHPEECHAKNS